MYGYFIWNINHMYIWIIQHCKQDLLKTFLFHKSWRPVSYVEKSQFKAYFQWLLPRFSEQLSSKTSLSAWFCIISELPKIKFNNLWKNFNKVIKKFFKGRLKSKIKTNLVCSLHLFYLRTSFCENETIFSFCISDNNGSS